jgi:hypothetical protein
LAAFKGGKTISIAGAEHHQTSNLEMMTTTLTEAVDADDLAAKLAADGLGLIRAKGFVTSRRQLKAVGRVTRPRFSG